MSILIVDENIQNFNEITELFNSVGASVVLASGSEEISPLLESDKFELALVSLLLVCGDQWRLLQSIKKNISLIIGLTDSSSSMLMQEGILHGIDSYMTKPIDRLSLQLYLPAILSHCRSNKSASGSAHDKEQRQIHDRRSPLSSRRWYDRLKHMPYVTHNDTTFKIGAFEINDLQKAISLNGQKIGCSPKEYKLLHFLIRNHGRVLSTQEILGHIWPDNDRASEEDVKQYIHLLRKKIEPDPARPNYIHTVKGFGYLANFTD